jgi:hypothetical protein
MLAWLLISHMCFSDAMTHVLEDDEIIVVVSGASGVIYNRNTNYLEVTVGYKDVKCAIMQPNTHTHSP